MHLLISFKERSTIKCKCAVRIINLLLQHIFDNSAGISLARTAMIKFFYCKQYPNMGNVNFESYI